MLSNTQQQTEMFSNSQYFSAMLSNVQQYSAELSNAQIVQQYSAMLIHAQQCSKNAQLCLAITSRESEKGPYAVVEERARIGVSNALQCSAMLSNAQQYSAMLSKIKNSSHRSQCWKLRLFEVIFQHFAPYQEENETFFSSAVFRNAALEEEQLLREQRKRRHLICHAMLSSPDVFFTSSHGKNRAKRSLQYRNFILNQVNQKKNKIHTKSLLKN